jgi:D-aminopeptidase
MGIAGVYRSEEWGAEITIAMAGGVPYAACSGELGDGFMVPLIPYAEGIWLMPCPRSLDYSAPGDWTLAFDGDRLRVGCWLARHIEYRKVK